MQLRFSACSQWMPHLQWYFPCFPRPHTPWEPEHRREPAALCPQLGASRPVFTVRITSSSARWVSLSVRCPFLRCKARLTRGGDIGAEVRVRVYERGMVLRKVTSCCRTHAACARCLAAQTCVPVDLGDRRRNEREFQVGKPLALVFHLRKNSAPGRRSPPGDILRAAGPGVPPAPSQPPGSARREVPGTTENSKGKGCGVGKARPGSPSASPAGAARVAPSAVRGCTAGQSPGRAPPSRAWERGGTRRRPPGGNRRGKPTEDA